MSASVLAVLVIENGEKQLPDLIESLRGQNRLINQVLVIDQRSKDHGLELVKAEWPEAIIIRNRRGSISGAINTGVKRALVANKEAKKKTDWIWLLSHAELPEHNSLAQLIRTIEVYPSVAVAGPKLVAKSDPNQIIEFGRTTTETGLSIPQVTQELDQGQFEKLSDLLAVSASGMLVKRSVWQELSGFDPVLDGVEAALDFSIRVRLSGYRVIAAPKVRVLLDEGKNPFRPENNPSQLRFSQLYRRLVYSPSWLFPLLVLALIPEGILRTLVQLFGKRLDLVLAELPATFKTVFKLAWVIAARKRLAKTAKLDYSEIHSLRQSRQEELANYELQRENNIFDDRDELSFFFGVGALTLALLTALGFFAFGSLFGSNYLSGGSLGELGTVQELWKSTFNSADLSRVPIDPFQLVLTGLGTIFFWNPSSSLVVLYLLALPLAGLGAWRLAGLLGSSELVRSCAAFIWALAPGFVTSLAEGRLSAVIAHLVLPYLVVAVLQARKNWTSTAWAGFLMIVLAASAPVLLPIAVIAVVLLTLVFFKSSYRLILIPIPAVLVFAPLILFFIQQGQPLGWLADPGQVIEYATAEPWQLALGFPEYGLSAWASWLQWTEYPLLISGILLSLVFAPLGLSAVFALLSKRTLSTIFYLGTALVGYLASVLVGQIELVNLAGESVKIWPGSTLSLYWLGLLAAFILAFSNNKLKTIPVLAALGSFVSVIPVLFSLLFGLSPIEADGRTLPAIVSADGLNRPQQKTVVVSAIGKDTFAVEFFKGSGNRIDQLNWSQKILPEYAGLSKETKALANLLVGVGKGAEELAEAGVNYLVLAEPRGKVSGIGLENQELDPSSLENYLATRAILNSLPEINHIGETSLGDLWRITDQLAEPKAELEPSFNDRVVGFGQLTIMLALLLASIPVLKTKRERYG